MTLHLILTSETQQRKQEDMFMMFMMFCNIMKKTVLETLPQNRKHGSKFPSPKAKTFIPISVNTNHVLSLDQPNEHVLNPTVVLQPENQQKIHAVHDESRENAQFSQLTTIFCKRIYVVKNN